MEIGDDVVLKAWTNKLTMYRTNYTQERADLSPFVGYRGKIIDKITSACQVRFYFLPEGITQKTYWIGNHYLREPDFKDMIRHINQQAVECI